VRECFVKGQVPLSNTLLLTLSEILSIGPKKVSPKASPTDNPGREVFASSNLLIVVIDQVVFGETSI
jgi:hypothetical protein